MEKNMGTIYKIENLVNGKVYVGQTVKKPKYRLHRHKAELLNNNHSNDYFQRAFNKYGLESFKASIIEQVHVDLLDEREVYWIKYYRLKDGVYNLEGGGNKNKSVADYTKSKISQAVRKSLENPITIERRKLANAMMRGSNNHNARQVICINDKKIYETLTEACLYYGANLVQISKVVTGERVSCYSKKLGEYLQFAYYKKGKVYQLRENTNIQEPKKVICINTGEIFRSTWEAAKTYNISQGSLVLCCQGERHSCGKDKNGTPLLWGYLENYDENKTYRHIKNEGARNPRSHPVVCITTGEYFESQRQAELKYNIAQGKISMVCTGKRKHAGRLPDGTKLKWEYAD